MRGYRVFDTVEKKYCPNGFYLRGDGVLLENVGGAFTSLTPADPKRYLVEEGTTVEGLKLSAGDIISVNGKHEKIVGFDEYGLYVENVSDVKNRKRMCTKQRPDAGWWSDFKRDIKVVGTIHDKVI